MPQYKFEAFFSILEKTNIWRENPYYSGIFIIFKL